MAWSNYEEAKTEKGTLEPLTIKGETFVFPSVPPAKFGIELMALIGKTGGKITDTDALKVLPYLMEDADRDRLLGLISFQELLGVLLDLLDAYGFRPKMENEPPNPEAPPTSEQNSSESSGRSNPIGSSTTDADSSTGLKQTTGATSSS